MFGMWRQGRSVASVCTERAKQHMGHVSGLSRIFVTFQQGQTLQRLCLSLPSSAAVCVNSTTHASLTHRPHFAPSIPFTNISFSSSSNPPKCIYMHSFFCETYDPDQSVQYHMFFISILGGSSAHVVSALLGFPPPPQRHLKVCSWQWVSICNKGKCYQENAILWYIMLVERCLVLPLPWILPNTVISL